MMTRCFWCKALVNCRYVEILDQKGKRLVPVCRQCARIAGKSWGNGKRRSLINGGGPV
jgi:hypothetical protein